MRILIREFFGNCMLSCNCDICRKNSHAMIDKGWRIREGEFGVKLKSGVSQKNFELFPVGLFIIWDSKVAQFVNCQRNGKNYWKMVWTKILKTLGLVTPIICLLTTKSTADGAPRGGMSVGPSGPWIRKFLLKNIDAKSVPMRVFIALFQLTCLALKSPATTLGPLMEKTLEKKFLAIILVAEGEQ